MADSSPDPSFRQRPSTPRWVKALGIAGILVVLLVVVVMLAAGGQHGPARHAPGDTGAPTPTATGQATADGGQLSAG
jgi:predicted small lipoprotein YifL